MARMEMDCSNGFKFTALFLVKLAKTQIIVDFLFQPLLNISLLVYDMYDESAWDSFELITAQKESNAQ